MRRASRLLGTLALALLALVASAGDEAPAQITAIPQIRALSVKQGAGSIPVEVTGVVTFSRTYGSFTVQSGDTGAFVSYSGPERYGEGDLVSISGVTSPGEFGPCIFARSVEKLGKAELPPPQRAKVEDLDSGRYDNTLLQLQGRVIGLSQKQTQDSKVYTLRLDVRGSIVNVHFIGEEPPVEDLLEADVAVTGIAIPYFNARRQRLGTNVMMHSAGDLEVRGLANRYWRTLPLRPLSRIRRYSPDAPVVGRIRVRGVMTFVGPDRIYLQEGQHGLRVEATGIRGIETGTIVEASGYETVTSAGTILLSHSVVRSMGQQEVAVGSLAIEPHRVSINDLVTGQYEGLLVRVETKLQDLVEYAGKRHFVLPGPVPVMAELASASSFSRNRLPRVASASGGLGSASPRAFAC